MRLKGDVRRVRLRLVLGVGFPIVLALSVVSCQRSSQEGRFAVQIQQAERWTIPPDSRVLSRFSPKTEGIVLKAEWEFESRMTEAEYIRWARENLTVYFKERSSASDHTFVRYDGGDSQSITLGMKSKHGLLDVRAEYSSYPD